MIDRLALYALIAIGLAGASSWYSYRAGREHQATECKAAAAREREVAALAAESAASAAAKAISKIKVQHRTVTQEVQREVLEREVYRDAGCSHSPEQLRRLNAALTGQPEPAGRGLVPRADAAGRFDLRRDDAQADRGGRDLP